MQQIYYDQSAICKGLALHERQAVDSTTRKGGHAYHITYRMVYRDTYCEKQKPPRDGFLGICL